jgi:hypothetical protein
MPVRRELTVRTTNLQNGDVVKMWPNSKGEMVSRGGGTHLLGARVVSRDYADVWHTIRFEDHELPKTKRWKSSWMWLVWREEPTEAEQAEEKVQRSLKMLDNARENARQKVVFAHQRIVNRPAAEVGWFADDARHYADAAAEWAVWDAILRLLESRNKRIANGASYASEDPFHIPEWTIAEAAWVWCTRKRDEILRGRMEVKQTWSDPWQNAWRTVSTHAEYEACTNEFHSIWTRARDWKEATDNLRKAKEAGNESASDSTSGDS